MTAPYTGLRRGELEKLVWADVQIANEKPHINARAVTTKNKKDAIVPLHPTLAAEFGNVLPVPVNEGAFVLKNGIRRHNDYLPGIEDVAVLGSRASLAMTIGR